MGPIHKLPLVYLSSVWLLVRCTSLEYKQRLVKHLTTRVVIYSVEEWHPKQVETKKKNGWILHGIEVPTNISYKNHKQDYSTCMNLMLIQYNGLKVTNYLKILCEALQSSTMKEFDLSKRLQKRHCIVHTIIMMSVQVVLTV